MLILKKILYPEEYVYLENFNLFINSLDIYRYNKKEETWIEF